MEKKDIRVSDTIPERPASFDETVERTLASVVGKEQQKETPVRAWTTENGKKRKRGSGRSIPEIVAIAAIFVVCVVSIGTLIALRPRSNKTAPSSVIVEEPTAPVIETRTVNVSTVDEFLAAIAPNTQIVLADGTYNLAEASDYGKTGTEYYSWEDRSDNWFREKEEISFELSLKGVENLTVTGSKNAQIVTVPRTAAVLSARSCAGLRLSGFTAGHTVAADPCEGEVIRLVECPNACVENCSLYGCGTWGVNAVDCDNLIVSGSDIYECSDGGVMFVRCKNTLMTGCTLRNCGYRDDAFSIIYVFDCKNLKITACDVYENRTDTVFNLVDDEVEGGSENVLLLGTSVHDNTVLGEVFHCNTESGPVVAGCEFKNNDGKLLPKDQHVYGLDGNRLNESDLLAMQLNRTVDADPDALPTPAPQPSNALVQAICVDGTVYIVTDFEAVAEPDESRIRYISSVVSLSEWPTEEGQANFGEVGTPYAMTADGLFVLYGNEWRRFEPTVKLEGDFTAEEPTPEPVVDPAFDGLCLFFDSDLYYAPFENWIWSDQDNGLAADGMPFYLKMDEVKDKIPTIYNPGKLTVKAGDGVTIEPQISVYDAELNPVAHDGEISIRTLEPGTYYVSQRVSRRETDSTSGYECIVRIVIGDENPVPEEMPAPEEGPNKLLIPAILYGEDLYVMHDELRPDAPDASAVKETVTSLTHITQWPQKSGQANFGEIGMAFYVTSDGLVVYYNGEWRLLLAQEPGDDSDKELYNDPNAFPGTFKFWDYDEVIGYREAPKEGVLFVCDFDGDGKKEEIRYQQHGSYLTISVGKKSIDVQFGAGLEQAILLDLDPASARLNLLVVYNTGSEDYETAELHMENGRFVRGPVIFAYCTYDGKTLLGSATQTDILGTKWGERTYHGENLTPDSEWYDCDVIPDDIPTARDRESLIEGGVLLHLVRDLPCTVDGADAVIPAGTYIYMTRWHESGTLAEIRTEDGTLTALVTVQQADPDDPEQYGYLIDGEMQDTYFDNIFYAD